MCGALTMMIRRYSYTYTYGMHVHVYVHVQVHEHTIIYTCLEAETVSCGSATVDIV